MVRDDCVTVHSFAKFLHLLAYPDLKHSIFTQGRRDPVTKEDKEAISRQRFASGNPFKRFPSYDALAADPRREPATALEEFEQRMKKIDKEESAKFATVGRLDARYEELKADADDNYQLASSAYSEVRQLERRLRVILGPIPHLDPNAEDPDFGWN